MQRLFYWSAGVGFGGAVLLQIAIANSYPGTSKVLALQNMMSILGVVQALAVLVGIYLFGKWVVSKIGERSEVGLTRAPSNMLGSDTSSAPAVNTKWKALAEYDDDIRAAVQTLRPYGPKWEVKFCEAFFALQEDRRYLRGIIDRLVEQAKAERAEDWKGKFRRTATGEICTDESIQVLHEAQEQGYHLSVDGNGTFLVQLRGTSYLHSNADILRFGEILRKRSNPST